MSREERVVLERSYQKQDGGGMKHGRGMKHGQEMKLPGSRQRHMGRWPPWMRPGQLVCLAAGLTMGICAELLSGTGSELEEGHILGRNSYGQGEAVYQLIVDGLGEESVPVEVVLSEQAYTREKAYEAYETVMKELPRLILGNNSSLEEVRYDLDLVTYLEDYGVRLRWESEDPDLLDSFGTVYGEGLGESGEQVGLRVRLTEGNWPKEYLLSVCVRPPVMTQEQEEHKGFMELLNKEDKRQAASGRLELPLEYHGRSLRYYLSKEPVFLPVTGLGAAAAALLYLKDKADVRRRNGARKHQMILDYPEVLSRLTIFLGAGMSIRTAWDRIALEYQRMRDQGRCKHRYVYEEMYETSCQMKGGVSEGTAFEEFGHRCGLQPYMKLGSLLEQNRRNGSKNLRDTLRAEMTDAFEQRKHQARRLGEEAGTKLLLPLFMLLSVVMVMIAVPALMEFR